MIISIFLHKFNKMYKNKQNKILFIELYCLQLVNYNSLIISNIKYHLLNITWTTIATSIIIRIKTTKIMKDNSYYHQNMKNLMRGSKIIMFTRSILFWNSHNVHKSSNYIGYTSENPIIVIGTCIISTETWNMATKKY